MKRLGRRTRAVLATGAACTALGGCAAVLQTALQLAHRWERLKETRNPVTVIRPMASRVS